MRDDFSHLGMVAAKYDLRGSHAFPVVREGELEHQPCLQCWLVGFCASAVSKACALIGRERGGASHRHDHGKFRLYLKVAGVELQSSFEHRAALPESAHADTQPGGFEKTGKSRGNEVPILSEFGEPGQSTSEFGVKSYIGQPDAELAGTIAADVAIADVGVIAFEIALDPARQCDVRVLRDPFELAADSEAARLNVELRIGIGPSVPSDQQGKRPVLASKGGSAAGGGVGNSGCLEETVDLHVGPAAEPDVGNHSGLLGKIDRQYPQRRNGRNDSGTGHRRSSSRTRCSLSLNHTCGA